MPVILWSVFLHLGFSSGFDLKTTDLNSYEYSTLNFKHTTHAFFTILKNNIPIVFFNIIGFTSLGILSLLSAALNGYSLGFLIFNSLDQGIVRQDIAHHIIPHGIFEIVGLWTSISAGLYSTFMFIMFLKGKSFTKNDFIFYLKLSAFSIILTLLSAYIEAFYTLSKYLCK